VLKTALSAEEGLLELGLAQQRLAGELVAVLVHSLALERAFE
jgi:hypothetical protein